MTELMKRIALMDNQKKIKEIDLIRIFRNTLINPPRKMLASTAKEIAEFIVELRSK